MSFQRKPFKSGQSSFSKKPSKGLKNGAGFKPSKGFGNKPASPKSVKTLDFKTIDDVGAEVASDGKSESPKAHAQSGFKSNSSFNSKPPKLGREVDAKKARKVLQALEHAREEAKANGADLSTWETEFLGSVETRIETYGSAFRDPYKGALDEPISNMQRVKLKEIHAKVAGKESRSGFGRKKKPALKRAPSRGGAADSDAPED